jgi:hypothetical protein
MPPGQDKYIFCITNSRKISFWFKKIFLYVDKEVAEGSFLNGFLRLREKFAPRPIGEATVDT